LQVIDEVSRHAFYGQSIHQHLYDVIDHRIEYRRPTILTTNEEDDGLEAILRPALLDRVKLHGGVLEFGNASYRARPRLEAGA
jgi:DNA replication protein DnaC